MTDSEKLAAILKLVESHATNETRYEANEDFCPSDDGNYDDVYNSGVSDGHTSMARAVLMIIKGE